MVPKHSREPRTWSIWTLQNRLYTKTWKLKIFKCIQVGDELLFAIEDGRCRDLLISWRLHWTCHKKVSEVPQRKASIPSFEFILMLTFNKLFRINLGFAYSHTLSYRMYGSLERKTLPKLLKYICSWNKRNIFEERAFESCPPQNSTKHRAKERWLSRSVMNNVTAGVVKKQGFQRDWEIGRSVQNIKRRSEIVLRATKTDKYPGDLRGFRQTKLS